ncbi:hypothetical protein ACIB24_09395 [Spongisporangium articulatum]|uniref:Uncharacterized protein n=1 Tax=Spongisporangium articulatum TaxID=3362603 RepID=A0ABW8ALM3_9ACTN
MAQVTPLPSIGEVFAGRDAAGRTLRVSAHPDSDRTVLSIWQDGRCLATLRLASSDIPEVVHALVSGIVPVDSEDRPLSPVRPLRPGEAPVTSQLAAQVQRSATELSDRTRRLGRRITSAFRDF